MENSIKRILQAAEVACRVVEMPFVLVSSHGHAFCSPRSLSQRNVWVVKFPFSALGGFCAEARAPWDEENGSARDRVEEGGRGGRGGTTDV